MVTLVTFHSWENVLPAAAEMPAALFGLLPKMNPVL